MRAGQTVKLNNSANDNNINKQAADKVSAALADSLNRYQRIAAWFWRYRWSWVLVPAVSVFILVFFFSADSGDVMADQSQQSSKLLLGLGMAAIAALLFGFYVAAVHTLVNRRFKWAIAVIVFPPLAFVYLWIANG